MHQSIDASIQQRQENVQAAVGTHD